MINLTQNSINNVILTLTESIQLTGTTSSGFTMTLQNKTTDKILSGITLTDISSYTNRYNEFNITLSGQSSEDISTSTLYLPENGFYFYSCHYTNSYDTEELENGLCNISGTLLPDYVVVVDDTEDYSIY